MYEGHVSTLFAQLPPMSDREGRVLGHLVASTMGHTTTIGIPNLQRRLTNPKTGRPASRSSIQRALRALEGMGLIQPAKRGPCGITQYRIVVPEASKRGALVQRPPALEERPPPPLLALAPALVEGPIHAEDQEEYQGETAGDLAGRPSQRWPEHVMAELKRVIG